MLHLTENKLHGLSPGTTIRRKTGWAARDYTGIRITGRSCGSGRKKKVDLWGEVSTHGVGVRDETFEMIFVHVCYTILYLQYILPTHVSLSLL